MWFRIHYISFFLRNDTKSIRILSKRCKDVDLIQYRTYHTGFVVRDFFFLTGTISTTKEIKVCGIGRSKNEQIHIREAMLIFKKNGS
jgi:hypothetical protein